MTLLANTSLFVTFLAIAVVGFIFVIASSVPGGWLGHGGPGHHADRGAAPSILSRRILSVFMTAFGSFGAIGIRLRYGLGVSVAMGLGAGVLFAGVIYVFAGFLYAQPASRHAVVGNLVGNTAQVSVGIPLGGVGQVRCAMGDTVVEKVARAAGNEAIPVNTLVKITTVVGDVVLVDRAEKSAPAADRSHAANG